MINWKCVDSPVAGAAFHQNHYVQFSHFVIPPFPFNTFWTNGQQSEKESWIRLKSPSFHSTLLLFTFRWGLRGNLCGIFTTKSMYILPFFYFFARCRRCRYAKCDSPRSTESVSAAFFVSLSWFAHATTPSTPSQVRCTDNFFSLAFCEQRDNTMHTQR